MDIAPQFVVPAHRRECSPEHELRSFIIDKLSLVAMVLGIIGLILPWGLATWSQHTASMVITGQNSQANSLSPIQRAEELNKAELYNESLINAKSYNASLGSDVSLDNAVNLVTYTNALNIKGDGVMGSIDIDKINVHLPIAHGVDDRTLQDNAGHMPQTSLPIGGSGTHSVIVAHRGLAHAEMFTRLNEMKVGDTFTIHVLNETLTYRVDKTSVVEPDDTSDIDIIPGEDLVTLLTCTPYGINTQRLLVRGTRVADPQAVATVESPTLGIEELARIFCLIAGVSIALSAVIYFKRGSTIRALHARY